MSKYILERGAKKNEYFSVAEALKVDYQLVSTVLDSDFSSEY